MVNDDDDAAAVGPRARKMVMAERQQQRPDGYFPFDFGKTTGKESGSRGKTTLRIKYSVLTSFGDGTGKIEIC